MNQVQKQLTLRITYCVKKNGLLTLMIINAVRYNIIQKCCVKKFNEAIRYLNCEVIGYCGHKKVSETIKRKKCQSGMTQKKKNKENWTCKKKKKKH